jgi:hypothetical protein
MRYSLLAALLIAATPVAAEPAPPLKTAFEVCTVSGPTAFDRLSALETAGWNLAEDSRLARELKATEKALFVLLWFWEQDWDANANDREQRFAKWLAEPERDIAAYTARYGPVFSPAAVVADLDRRSLVVLQHRDVPGILNVAVEVFDGSPLTYGFGCSFATTDLPQPSDLAVLLPDGVAFEQDTRVIEPKSQRATAKSNLADGREFSLFVEVYDLTGWPFYEERMAFLGSEHVLEAVVFAVARPVDLGAP